METFAMYLVKSASWLSGFALVYFLFLRNERFFTLKRIFLITGIIVSMVFPLFSFNYSVEVPLVTDFVQAAEFSQTGTEEISRVQQVSSDEPFKINFGIILLIIYLSGILFFALRIIFQAKSLLKKIGKENTDNLGQAKLIRASEFSSSFSFFNYVFINPAVNETEMESIINHELVHIRQKHWFDLILVEIICLLQWMNPFSWFYSRFIRLNHEYIADQVALEMTPNPANYKATLLNQMFRSPVVILSNSFNYSSSKKRFEMMKTIKTSPYRKLKVLFVLPVFAIVFYAFATPEYHYATPENNSVEALTIYESPVLVQKQVKGIVLDEIGHPVEGVAISSTGQKVNVYHMTTRSDGRFLITNVKEDASLLFFNVAYKRLILKPGFTSEMTVKLEKDPDYVKPSVQSSVSSQRKVETLGEVIATQQKFEPIVVIDGVITESKPDEAIKELGYDMGIGRIVRGKEATDKYGEKGANGVYEITTRKKAIEMGLKPPFRRLAPGDYPTFQNGTHENFREWVLSQVQYPEEAQQNKVEGWITITFKVELDGAISDAAASGVANKILSDEVIRVVKSSPKWEPPKNPDVDEPYRSMVMVRFRLPNTVSKEIPPFVVVEEMPLYPGGSEALLGYIAENLKYPPEARKDSIQGRVILRFIVTAEGNTEDITVLKGVHPLLDAEAVRVVGMITGWKPGKQGGKPVNVWYMVPVNFALSDGTQPSNP